MTRRLAPDGQTRHGSGQAADRELTRTDRETTQADQFQRVQTGPPHRLAQLHDSLAAHNGTIYQTARRRAIFPVSDSLIADNELLLTPASPADLGASMIHRL